MNELRFRLGVDAVLNENIFGVEEENSDFVMLFDSVIVALLCLTMFSNSLFVLSSSLLTSSLLFLLRIEFCYPTVTSCVGEIHILLILKKPFLLKLYCLVFREKNILLFINFWKTYYCQAIEIALYTVTFTLHKSYSS